MKTEFDFVGSVKVDINKEGHLVIYDIAQNIIYSQNKDGYAYWADYDNNHNMIHQRDSNGIEEWYKCNSDGDHIYYKDSCGYEEWYDAEGDRITEEEYIKNSQCTDKTITIDGKDYILIPKENV